MPAFVLDLRSDPRGGAVVPARLTSGTLDELQQCRSVVFMVHGFNVDRADGTVELTALGARLPAMGAGATVAVLWPGDSIVGPLSYPFETSKADDSAVELATYIGENLPQHPAISFIGHSLGCRVVMETVRQLWMKGIAVSQVCVMAAAIDNDSLGAAVEYFNAAEFAARVGVLWSPSDQVLEFAYPLGNLLSAFIHWSETSDAALGYTGPRASRSPPGDPPADVQGVGIPADYGGGGVNHGDYLPDAQGNLNDKQQAAARFANSMLGGDAPLSYG
jgi:hypothetical protein